MIVAGACLREATKPCNHTSFCRVAIEWHLTLVPIDALSLETGVLQHQHRQHPHQQHHSHHHEHLHFQLHPHHLHETSLRRKPMYFHGWRSTSAPCHVRTDWRGLARRGVTVGLLLLAFCCWAARMRSYEQNSKGRVCNYWPHHTRSYGGCRGHLPGLSVCLLMRAVPKRRRQCDVVFLARFFPSTLGHMWTGVHDALRHSPFFLM